MHNFECTGQFCGWQKLKESALTLRIFRENNLQLRPKRTPATSPRFICGQGRRSFYCESSLHGAHPLQPEGWHSIIQWQPSLCDQWQADTTSVRKNPVFPTLKNRCIKIVVSSTRERLKKSLRGFILMLGNGKTNLGHLRDGVYGPQGTGKKLSQRLLPSENNSIVLLK